MTSPAIVSLLWPKNFGVLEALVCDNPGTRVFASEGSEDPELVRRIAAAGGELSPLDALLSVDDLARSIAESTSRVSRLEAVLGGEEWSRFSSDHGWSGERLGDIIGKRAQADLPGMATAIAALERIRSLHTVRLVIVNEDFTPGCRAVVLWAKEHGIPSLHLLHALDLFEPYTVHGRVVSDTLAMFGERGVEHYLDGDTGVSADRIRVTGNPAWDAYPELVSRREAVRAALAVEHGLEPSLPWVVFATTWVANLTALSDKGAFGETLRLFLQGYKALVDAGRQIEIVVKDRAPNEAFGSSHLAGLVSELGIDEDHVCYTVDGIERWIVAADVVVSVYSNVSVEAIMACTAAINLVTEMDAALSPPFDAESGIVEAEGHELAAALERILSDGDYRDGLRDQMRRAAPHHNLGCDGTSTERVVGLMQEMALPVGGRLRRRRRQARLDSAGRFAPVGRMVDPVKKLLTFIRHRYRYPLIIMREMVITDFKLRYQASLLGYLWTLLRPLALFSILYVVFVRFLKLGRNIPYNPVYLLFGIVVWEFFTQTTSQGLAALVARADLLRKISFPRYVVVLSVGASVLISFFLNMLVIVMFMSMLGVPVRLEILWLPFLFLELVALSISLAFFLSAAFVRFRDLNYIWEVAMQAGFYLTPIIYPLTLVRDANPTAARLLILSPIAQIIQDARYCLVTDQTETISQLYGTPWMRLVPVGITLILSVTSVVYFRRRSPTFAEEA